MLSICQLAFDPTEVKVRLLNFLALRLATPTGSTSFINSATSHRGTRILCRKRRACQMLLYPDSPLASSISLSTAALTWLLPILTALPRLLNPRVLKRLFRVLTETLKPFFSKFGNRLIGITTMKVARY